MRCDSGRYHIILCRAVALQKPGARYIHIAQCRNLQALVLHCEAGIEWSSRQLHCVWAETCSERLVAGVKEFNYSVVEVR